MFACPISRMNALYRARISVREEACHPGLVFAGYVYLDNFDVVLHGFSTVFLMFCLKKDKQS